MADKKCSKCGDLKPLEQFYKMKANSTGYGPWCKGCMDVRKREWEKANPERHREMQLANAKKHGKERWLRRKINPQHQEYMRQYSAEWYAENKDRLKAIRRAWYLKNKDEHNKRSLADYYANTEKWQENAKKWAKENPERWREMMHNAYKRRRAIKAGATGQWTLKDEQEKFSLQRGKCAVCKKDLVRPPHKDTTADHIIALVNGGSNDKLNLQILCRSCNSRKHAKDPIRFMQENGFLL